MTFRAALVQMRSGADRAANIATMRAGVAEAAGQGARYVQTPEVTGMIADAVTMLKRAFPQRDDPCARAASELAQDHGVWLHVGSTAVLAKDGRLANRAFMFAPDGTLRATYDKLHMFDVDLPDGETWRESASYKPGDASVTLDLPFARMGLAICYDLRFPIVFATQASGGASVLTAPAAFTAQTGRAHWDVLVRARAIECGAWMLAAAQGGYHTDGDGRRTWGRSVAVDPWGTVVGMLDHDEPGVLTVEVDPTQANRARQRVPNLRSWRRFAMRHVDEAASVTEAVAPTEAKEAAE